MATVVLIIAAQNSTADSLQKELEQMGITVLRATAVTAGVASALIFHPQLIVLDGRFPMASGVELGSILQEYLKPRLVSIILLVPHEDRQEAKLGHGTNLLIADEESVREVVRRCLHQLTPEGAASEK